MARVTKKQALEAFRRDVLPEVRRRYEQDGVVDKVARREEWNNFTDALCKARQITQHQYDNWTNPF